MRTALASIALGLVGLALLLFVASTAGPPDGYRRFSQRGAHVYLPDRLEIRATDQGETVVRAADRRGDMVEVTDVPTDRRSLAAFVRLTRAGIAGRQGRITRDASIGVDGADEARELRIDYAGAGVHTTQLVARRGARFLTLTVAGAVRGGAAPFDANTVVDSFYLD
jgi:hypothetical protein